MKMTMFPYGIGSSNVERYKKIQIISAIKEMLEWGRERLEEGESVYLLTCSGITHPDIWNPLEEDIFRNLSIGMRFTHWAGPIICTDNNDRNSVISAYAEYPEKVKIRLARTFNLYHWILIGAEGETFKLLGECYHKPLSTERYCYQTDSDQDRGLHLSKQYEYDMLKPITDEPSSIHEIPTLRKAELGVVLEKIKNMRRGETYITKYIEDDQEIEIITGSPVSEDSRLFVSKVKFDLLCAKDIMEILFPTKFPLTT